MYTAIAMRAASSSRNPAGTCLNDVWRAARIEPAMPVVRERFSTLSPRPPGSASRSSASWRAQHTDEDLFNDAIESVEFLYRPHEGFAVGLLDGAGAIEAAAPMDGPCSTLDCARRPFPGSPRTIRWRRSFTGLTADSGLSTKANEPSKDETA
jgi:hypothetical protein